MPTSATGTEPPGRRGTSEGGFTLFEILVVVAIIAIVATAAVLQVRPRQAEDPAATVRALAGMFEMVKDEAIFSHREFGIEFAHDGVRVYELGGDSEWHAVREPDRLADGLAFLALRAELEIEERVVVLRPSGGSSEPQAFILSSGETTPLRLRLATASGGRNAMLSLDPFGRIEIGGDR